MEIKNKCVNKGISYIIENLRNNLTVEDVANHCHVSRYHFSRLFKECTGESIYSLIKRLKMEESAIFLGTNTENSITDIGMSFGYSASNYSSAFSRHHGISPAKFRQLKINNKLDLKNPINGEDLIYHDFDYYDRNVTVRVVSDVTVIYKRFMGSYSDMVHHWPLFISDHKDVFHDDSQLIEICYNDPNITRKERCLFDLCIIVDELDSLPSHLSGDIRVIQGGKFASYRVKGDEGYIGQDYKGLFNIWLPKSRFVMDDRLRFDSYKCADPNNLYFEMDINIPIK